MTREEKIRAITECLRLARSIEDLADMLSEHGVEVKRDGAVWLEGYSAQPCSNCGYRGKRSWRFCPSCGREMRAALPGEKKKDVTTLAGE